VHDRGTDIFAGSVEFNRPVASTDKTTQCQQTASTGSGGTEVKTSIKIKIEQFYKMSIRILINNVKSNVNPAKIGN
jgi:hypothetical protein